LGVMASEAGVLPIPDARITKKWRLQPGKMFLIDLEEGRIIEDDELKDSFARAETYRTEINRIRLKLDELKLPKNAKAADPVEAPKVSLLDRQQAFGYTQEDLRTLLSPMALEG